jgi:23S rRNA (adenine1618-N6)-methyltransferase
MTRRAGGAPAPSLHPRNRHQGRYDFPALVAACPELHPYVRPNPYGDPSIDFADPQAVVALNRALLAHQYGLRDWVIPEGYLCPPIPGRADYVHHLADLMATDGLVPRGPAIRVLDIGVGAGAIYPLLGHLEYGWSFVGTDVDKVALAAARRNAAPLPAIELRLQPEATRIFEGVVRPGERFEACLCNPPFHASAAEAREGSARKWRNLGRGGGPSPILNFGGQGGELWCPGGEGAFLRRMISESARQPDLCRWFTALVARSEHLAGLKKALREAGATTVRVVEMGQGQKRSRVLAWSFPSSPASAPAPGSGGA